MTCSTGLDLQSTAVAPNERWILGFHLKIASLPVPWSPKTPIDMNKFAL